jgi:hypothetical protein
MNKARLLPIVLLVFLISIITFLLSSPQFITKLFATNDHVMISEIQIAGDTPSHSADDEFVELYNPTSNSINMNNWRLSRINSGGTPSILVSNINDNISPFGFYLITNPYYNGAVSSDKTYSNSTNGITNNDTIIIFSDAGSTVVDKVGLGVSFDKETISCQNPPSNGSVVRANLQDTDNNSVDFSILTISDPQNSASVSVTPTPTVTITPTETPILTNTPTPTLTPTPTITVTPTPTSTPTPTITLTPTPTETIVVTLTPTITITPTPIITLSPTEPPIPTDTPTIIPTPTLYNIRVIYFPNGRLTCGFQYYTLNFGWFTLKIPRFTCNFI